MVKSKNFDKVKMYYNKHLWNKRQVANAVVKAWITEDEYAEIVGEPYSAEEE